MSEMSREEALAHYGVKGMHWGVRKESSSSTGGSSKPKKQRTTTKDIKDARRKSGHLLRKLAETEDAVYGSKATSAKGKAAAEAALKKAENEYMSNDRIASKFTRGESVALTLIGGPVGLAVVAANAASTRAPKK